MDTIQVKFFKVADFGNDHLGDQYIATDYIPRREDVVSASGGHYEVVSTEFDYHPFVNHGGDGTPPDVRVFVTDLPDFYTVYFVETSVLGGEK